VTSILVVDDGATDRELLATVLRYAGYTVLEAETGELGLELARTEHPDLIIVDILMPTMDGYDLVRELRANPTTAGIRVIFYTATYVIDEIRRLATACGVAHIIIKPCKPEEIIRVVGDALSSPEAPVPPVPSEEFHREHLRVLNAKLLQKVEELRDAMVVAGSLHQKSARASDQGSGAAAPAPARRLEEALSPRELQVVAALAEGRTNAEIGERLVIASSTVQSHVKNILRKLGVRNRTEAAARYLRDQATR
jgi:DNA-binding NarL/FixJ family response regulator